MSHRYSTALSHIALAGTSGFCLLQIKGRELDFPHFTFGIIVINSIIGLWKWGNPYYGMKAYRLYRFTSFLQELFALSCIATIIWITNGYTKELGWAHTAAGFFPLIFHFIKKHRTESLVDVVVMGNVMSLGIVSFLFTNYYGIVSAISYAFAHFFIRRDGDFTDSIPAQDLYNYSLCFFAFFALKAVSD